MKSDDIYDSKEMKDAAIHNGKVFRKMSLAKKVDNDIASYAKAMKNYGIYMKLCVMLASLDSLSLLFICSKTPQYAIFSVFSISFMLMAFVYSRDIARMCAKQQAVIVCANIIAADKDLDVPYLERCVKNYDNAFGMI